MVITLEREKYEFYASDVVHIDLEEILDLCDFLSSCEQFELIAILKKQLCEGNRYMGNYNINVFIDIFKSLNYEQQQELIKRFKEISPDLDYYNNALKNLQEHNNGGVR